MEEALRRKTPLLSVARSAAEEVEVGGVCISEGFVSVSLGAARDAGAAERGARPPEPSPRRGQGSAGGGR
jgi:hypothetical protein